MDQKRDAARWDRAFGAGKYDFLRERAETARLRIIAQMIDRSVRSGGRCEVVDIGCGEGLLLSELKNVGGIARYVGVDISAVALSRVPEANIPVETVRSPLGRWDGSPNAVARRVIVASEVLYYDDDAVAALDRLALGPHRISEIIVSCVAGRQDKPNWTEASERLWRELRGTGWTRVETRYCFDRERQIGWDIVRYAV